MGHGAPGQQERCGGATSGAHAAARQPAPIQRRGSRRHHVQSMGTDWTCHQVWQAAKRTECSWAGGQLAQRAAPGQLPHPAPRSPARAAAVELLHRTGQRESAASQSRMGRRSAAGSRCSAAISATRRCRCSLSNSATCSAERRPWWQCQCMWLRGGWVCGWGPGRQGWRARSGVHQATATCPGSCSSRPGGHGVHPGASDSASNTDTAMAGPCSGGGRQSARTGARLVLLQQTCSHLGQAGQQVKGICRQAARPQVKDAQRAEAVAAGRHQGSACGTGPQPLALHSGGTWAPAAWPNLRGC